MPSIRRVLILAGIVAGVGGLLLVAYPPLAASLSMSQVLVYGLGGLCLLLVLSAVQRRRSAETQQAETGKPEFTTPLPKPGSNVDRVLRVVGLDREGEVDTKSLRDRLRELAVRVVSRRREVTREGAEELLESGEWTSDPYAAAYFADDYDLTLRQRLYARHGGEGSRTATLVHHTIDALADPEETGSLDHARARDRGGAADRPGGPAAADGGRLEGEES